MKKSITNIEDNQKWAVRAIIAACISVVVTVIGALLLVGIKFFN